MTCHRLLVIALLLLAASPCPAQHSWPFIMPEQREIQVRDPAQLPAAPLPAVAPPLTVSHLPLENPEVRLSLDDAIQIALANSEVVRILAGVQAASSGVTIYDPAISNTAIDREQARFDPTVQALNSFNRSEIPQAFFDPLDPTRTVITGTRVDNYTLDVDVAKTTITGGTLALGVNAAQDRFRPGIFPLNPQTRSSAELSYTQPLLQGGGIAANMVPIVLARIDTERSFFQLKDAMQEMVRGVVEAYWGLVFARVDVWARLQQVQQADASHIRARGRLAQGFGSAAEVSQARVALVNFRANLITAEANLLEREAGLRNLLGLSPSEAGRLVPVTPPTLARVDIDWAALLSLAQEQRPDIIELKLIIEADQQLLLQARNQAQPRLDAIGLYRWNGLEGEMPIGTPLESEPGQFTDWTLGINFSVPLGLRQSRAQLRQQELIIQRDRANLEQGVHQVVHALAASVRRLDQFYEQYQLFGEAREAARVNLEQQIEEERAGRTIPLNVLQALTDWGNAVSAEAQALAQYNTELVNLERETGTILETHSVRFFEERFRSLGPLGRLGPGRCYPQAMVPASDTLRYATGNEPAETIFRLEEPFPLGERLEELPPPD